MKLSPLNRRRWRNFKRNKRALWSLIIFSVLMVITLPAEFVANDRPILVRYQGEFYTPIFNFYPETAFGGDFATEAIYADPEVECLIVSGGREDCFDDPEGVIEDAQDEFHEDPILYSAYAFFAAGAVSVASLAIAFCFHGLPL